ncbi:hypothetical protein F2P56_011995 [Juglans regia]|uniref:Uncharacterized protein LOC109005388 isoform X1 n=2 Tax=Juglans regia TaxID=51240 RepID=A0A2I4G7I6_JUGRE|nr:uncharacterized protein LOC109005388 isoform X1 [Juglans regia]KAF5467778.1 hypothetical protein F2P56_011995 [Juglans regia]
MYAGVEVHCGSLYDLEVWKKDMESSLEDVTICQKCGDRGFSVALIYCAKCQVSAEHRYCLEVLPATFDEYVTWFCDDCEPKVGKLYTINLPSPFPPRVRHSVDSENKRAVQSRIGLNKNNNNIQGLKDNEKFEKNKKKKKKKKKKNRRDISVSVVETDVRICDSIPSLQLNETHCGEIWKKGQKLGQGYPKLCDIHCGEKCEEGQKLGQESGLHLKDGANLDEGVEDVSSSIQCIKTHGRKNCEKDLKLGQEFRLDLNDGTSLDGEIESLKTSQIATSDVLERHVPSQPIVDPIWRGSLCICNNSFDPLSIVAHLSSLACSKVCEETKLIPELLYAELLLRSQVWPKGFEKWGPTDQSIALYFFPDNESDEIACERLVKLMIGQDLALRSLVKNAELLVFPSKKLPVQYWRFQGKFYLWGVFRQKKQKLHR